MLKGLKVTLVLTLLVTLMTACSSAKAPDAGPGSSASARIGEIQKKGVLVVGTANYRPFEYHDEKTNQLVGFDVDVADQIAKSLGVKVEWKEMQFAGLIPALQAGQVDMVIAAMYITDQRKEVVDFADPYVDTGLVMITRKNDDRIKSLSDLDGKTVGVKLGATGAKAADRLKQEGRKIEIKQYNDTLDSFSDLLVSRVDVVFNDKLNTLEYLKTHPQLQIVGDTFDKASLGISVKKGDKDLLDRINDVVRKMKSQGQIDQLFQKWLKS